MQPQPNPTIRYRTFILTLWEEIHNQPAGYCVWRFSLEHSHAGQRIGFKSLEELMRYLQMQIEAEQKLR